MREHSHYKEQLIAALEELKFTGKQCEMCFRYFGDKTPRVQKVKCDICENESRDRGTLMILEKGASNMDAIEKPVHMETIFLF